MGKLSLEIIVEARKQLAVFAPAQAEAVLIARKELGFEISEESYRTEYQRHFSEMDTKVATEIERMQRELNAIE
jgi:hypothetical protein